MTTEQFDRAPVAGGSISCRRTLPGGRNDGGGGGDLDISVREENTLSVSSSFQPAVPIASSEKARLSVGVGQKRGRAQKKRAKKIKDKMRELCLEAAAVVSTTAAYAGAGTASVNQGPPHTSFDVSGSYDRGTADCSDGNLSVENHRGDKGTSDTQGLTLSPRFARAATDLIALARVRVPCKRCCKTPALLSGREECSEVGASLASETASSSSNAEDTVATVAAAKVATNAAAAAATTPAALSPPSPNSAELLQNERVCGNGPTVAMKETAGSSAANEGAGGSLKGLSSVDPCDADGLPPASAVCENENIEGNGALARVLVEGRGMHEQQHRQGAEEIHVLENRSRGGALESAAISEEGPLGDKDAVPRYKKTRRGKRAGGASNRRRGPKPKAKVRSGETPVTAHDAGRVDGKDTTLRGVTREGTVAPPTLPLRDAGIQTHEEGPHALAEGESGDRNSPGDTATCCDNGRDEDGVCSCTSCSVDIAALECAALMSLRDLRSLIASPTTARGQTGADSLVESRLQSSGVLESLVALCAPYPWAPIPLLHGTFPGGLPVCTWETPEHVGGQEAHGEVASAVDTPSRSVSTCSSMISAEGVHVDDAVHAATSRNGATVATRTTAAFGGLRGAGSREAVMEGALSVLSRAFEDPKNRDYVLRIDGATPLVRSVFRENCVHSNVYIHGSSILSVKFCTCCECIVVASKKTQLTTLELT